MIIGVYLLSIIIFALALNLLKGVLERSKIPFNKFRASAEENGLSRHKGSSGYIMIFTLLAIGAAMVVVTYVGHRASYYLPFSTMIHDREKAKMLALSGVQIAIAQLAQADEKSADKSAKENTATKPENAEQNAQTGQTEKKNSPEKQLLSRILPTLNRWQDFQLTEHNDGIDGRIQICLMCEEGKINLNRIIDFKKNTFHGDEKSGWKVIMQEICKAIDRVAKTGDLFAAFEKIVKEAEGEFNDATELITHKEFSHFKDTLFYQPPIIKKQETLYLTDIFTVWSSSDKVEPWLFSDSINGLLGLPRVEVDDIKKRKEQVEGWLKNFKEKSNWQQDWQKILQPMYGKELRTLPKHIDSILSTSFAPRYFSVLIHAHIEKVTQVVYAILERNKDVQGDGTAYDVIIKKLYWL